MSRPKAPPQAPWWRDVVDDMVEVEARLSIGSGYRLYFAQHQRRIILLLLGGKKASQKEDIRRAQRYWSDYLEGSHGTT